MFAGLTGWHLIVLSVFWLIPLLLWLRAVIQIGRAQAESGPTVAWLILVTMLPVVGAILWFTIGRSSVQRSRAQKESGPGTNSVAG